MSEAVASCSVPPSYAQDEFNTSKRRKPNHHAPVDSLTEAPRTSAMPRLNGKERQRDVHSTFAASHAPGIDTPRDYMGLLVLAAGVQPTPLSKSMQSWTATEGDSIASKERWPSSAHIDACQQCIITPPYPTGDAGTTEECCNAPCPLICSAIQPSSASPPETTSPCSASVLECCEDPQHLLDVDPTIIACQGTECVDAAVVVCSDAECAAVPVSDILVNLSGDCPDTCKAAATLMSKKASLPIQAQETCPACDDQTSNAYSSFQELLDCWCCSDSDLTRCSSNDGKACADLSIDYENCCIDRPGPTFNVAQYTPAAASMSSSSCTRSRDTSISQSTQQSPSLRSQESFEASSQCWSGQGAIESLREMQTSEDLYKKCLYEEAHRHDEQGMCVAPIMTLHNHYHNQDDNMARHSLSSAPNSLHICHWAGCGLQCASVTELARHVNAVHLALAAPIASEEAVASRAGQDEQTSSMLWGQQDNAWKCLWDSCQMQENVSGATWQDGSLILEHILQAHVGVDEFISAPGSSSVSKRKYKGDEDNLDTSKHIESSFSLRKSATEEHSCRWAGCSEVFTSHEELTNHLIRMHVGSGKAQYTCQWQGCDRGDRTFYQKQKILRHLQTHTGYRPHICSICEKRFSELSTLAQHQRTHTKEKPYACDYPGCGKSFAVAASLTIHKRVHTGERPFKCKWPDCNIAFSESSNLRKHMRIHTGERPFICTQEGCNKTFSRPDQLARHRKTHRSKDEQQ